MVPASRLRATLVLALVLLVTCIAAAAGTSSRLALDDSDRDAFRAWFTFLADAQFERRTADVIDCASLVRHAYREALRPHTPAWFQTAKLPRLVAVPDVRHTPPTRDGALLLFRIQASPERYAEFADAETIVRLNTRRIGRDVRAAQPGDLLYFRHADSDSPSHLMVFLGGSAFDRDRQDWLVYHTGPDGASPGEVRKVSMADLARHPSPRWRPIPANPEFVGVMRLSVLDQER
jgi:uncharacterized protein YfaT (DUF1175 family)